MSNARKPPTTRGRKVSAAYAAMVGQSKSCQSCNEQKEVEWRTFAPARRSPDGVSSICRVCQGRAAKTKQIANRLSGQEPVRSGSWPTDPRAYWAQVEELSDRLYATGGQPHRQAELEEICQELNKVTRLRNDAAGGGEALDEELAFRTFAYIVSRLISSWLPFGTIHDDDLIPAVLDDSDQVLILASRNAGKSQLVELLATWWLHRNPMDIIGVVSGGTKRAKRTLKSVRQFITNCPLIRYLEPDDTCLDASDQFVTPQANGRIGASVSFSSFGISSTMVGFRFNKAILDDVETKADRTASAQESLDLLTSEITNILNPGGHAICIGTPQVQGMSIYARWEASGDWSFHRALLFRELPQDEGTSKKPYLESRWPQRFSDAELEKKRRLLPAREWDLHWRLDLSALDEDLRPLKLRYFTTVDHDPYAGSFPTVIRSGGPVLSHIDKPAAADADDNFHGPREVSADETPYLQTVAAVDPASGMEGRDEVGVAIIGVSAQGLGVIRCMTGVRGESAPDTLLKTASLLHQYYPSKIICEARADSLYPDQLASVLARRGFRARVDAVYSGSKKGERIIDSTLTPMSDGRLVMLESVATAPDAMESLTQIVGMTGDARSLRRDDRLDALAWAISAVGSSLVVDETDQLETASRQKMEELIGLPLRKGGIKEDGLEARTLGINEGEERLIWKLERAEEQLLKERRAGHIDAKYERYVDKLRAEVDKFRRLHILDRIMLRHQGCPT